MNNYLVYALIAVFVFTLYMAILHLLRKDRMRERVLATGAEAFGDEVEKESGLADFCAAMLGMIGIDVKNQKELNIQLLQAGILSPHGITYYLFFKRFIQPIILVIGGYIFFHALIVADLALAPRMEQVIGGGVGVAIGLFGANMYVSNRKQHRQQKILYSFPEALDLLLVCIESGLGLDAALNRVCTEMKKSHPEIAQELDRTRIELTVLNDRTQALQNLAERSEVVAIKSLVASLIQTEKFGTSLTDTLRVLSDDQRSTRLLNAENKAAKIPVLITIPLIICTLPALFIVILGPPIIKVMDQGGMFGSSTPNR